MAGKNMFGIGQKVEYTNPQGVFIGIKTITGTEIWDGHDGTRYFIAPTDTPWFSVRESCLKKANIDTGV